MEFIRRVMETVGVSKWEDLAGKHIRADSDHGKIYGIGHIIKDQWFYPDGDRTLTLALAQDPKA